MPESDRTIIVGGGIVGTSAAYYLARRGHAVTLLEQQATNTGASTGNAGIIALGHAPLPRPGLVGQTLRMLMRRTNPVYVAPRLDLDLFRWLWRFRRSCTTAHFDHCMDVLARLGHGAGACFEQIVGDERIDAEYHQSGWMEIYRTPESLQEGRGTAELTRSLGFQAETLDGDELRRREPAFRDEIVGAIHYTDSAFANPGRFLAALTDRAAAHGADIRAGVEVEHIDLDDDRFRSVHTTDGEAIDGARIVLAAGSWTTRLARTIGVSVPMQPGKGYHLNLARPDPCPSTTCVLAERFVAVTPLDGGLRLAGTVELSGINLDIVQRRVEMLRIGAERYVRGIADLDVESVWCGLRPCTADGLPVVGWAPRAQGVYIATGHAMMGFALGPVTGRLVSEAVLDGDTSIDIQALSPARFDGRRRRAAG
ncbi:MAG: NAD(P)/FAD-dependent oxidoreductase [Planctomycetota bacterium]